MNTGNSGALVREILLFSLEAMKRGETPTDEQISAKTDELFERMKRGEL